ncbi:MAG: PadR family transcriptional regulator [Lachnospiraceae bacterium]|jgi:PadR family transcriptional regulator PadR|nr:PadR family transcriptional regulator [Lachnospiraceae bacterium]
MNLKYEKQLKKGVLEILVLRLLAEEAKYGYLIIQELRERGGDLFSLKEGTLYPILYRLEEDQLVESQWSAPKGKETARKYYKITPSGRQELIQMTELWDAFSGAVTTVLHNDQSK